MILYYVLLTQMYVHLSIMLSITIMYTKIQAQKYIKPQRIGVRERYTLYRIIVILLLFGVQQPTAVYVHSDGRIFPCQPTPNDDNYHIEVHYRGRGTTWCTYRFGFRFEILKTIKFQSDIVFVFCGNTKYCLHSRQQQQNPKGV